MKPVLTLLAGPNGGGKSYYSHFFVENGFISTLPINIDALE
jgi:predicted ABC-type ATPase